MSATPLFTIGPALFTIGYEATTLDCVLAELARAGVAHLVDVRALPQSRKPGFSKSVLSASLVARGIRYTHLRGLGTPKAGRDAVRRGDVAGMTRIFAAHMESDPAQADLAQARLIADDGGACLLCFERDHTQCHRSIVAAMMQHAGPVKVQHLTAALPNDAGAGPA